jgi:hypothetical protein
MFLSSLVFLPPNSINIPVLPRFARLYASGSNMVEVFHIGQIRGSSSPPYELSLGELFVRWRQSSLSKVVFHTRKLPNGDQLQ